VRGFLLPEASKQRLRPIFEPRINDEIFDTVPEVHYLSRLERRQQTLGRPFCAQYDIAAAFDQVIIPEASRDRFVFRTGKGDDEVLMRLTRLPMGARWSPCVMQAVLQATIPAAEMLRECEVVVSTMIDNVRFLARTQQGLERVTAKFLENIRRANITLNPDGGLVTSETYTFLGEEYQGESVRNAKKLVDKVDMAHARWQEEGGTARQFLALVGLIIFMSHTLGVRLAEMYGILKAASACSANGGNWERRWELTSAKAQEELTKIVQILRENTWVRIRKPSDRKLWDDYPVQVMTDASRFGFGAFIIDRTKGTTIKIVAPWANFRRGSSSASAEPEGVYRCLTWLRTRYGYKGPVAVATDHIALVEAQLDKRTGHRGHSRAFYLNRALTMVGIDDELFYIPGENNIADVLSRDDCRAECGFRAVTVEGIVMPAPWPNEPREVMHRQ
jgi:hypothetical protein